MAKKNKQESKQQCGDCKHYYACAAWNIGSITNMDGTNCANFERYDVNTAPVVRGRWIHGCTQGAGTEYCCCSVCSEDALKDKGGYTEFSNYCPNCGAKMGGK